MKTELKMLGDEPLVTYGGYPLYHWVQKAKFSAQIKMLFLIFISIALAVVSIEFNAVTINEGLKLNLLLHTRNQSLTIPIAYGLDASELVINTLHTAVLTSLGILLTLHLIRVIRLKRTLSTIKFIGISHSQLPNIMSITGYVILSFIIALIPGNFFLRIIGSTSLFMGPILKQMTITLLLDDEIYHELGRIDNLTSVGLLTIGVVTDIKVSEIAINDIDKQVVPYLNSDYKEENYE